MSDIESDEPREPSAEAPSSTVDPQEEDVGCLPAVMAFGLLLTAALFVFCGVSTYFLYQKRDELAARTLGGNTVQTVEQSQLEPRDKQAIKEMLIEVVEDAESGQLENWQASGVMNRLSRIPFLEWGDLAAVESLIQTDEGFDEPAREEAGKQFSRLRHAIVSGEATTFDVNEVVSPVLVEDESLRGRRLASSPTSEQLQEVVIRARLVADRHRVEDRVMPADSIVTLIRKEIEAGRTEGER